MLPSAFDVLGPIMVGPSSSHTAGALKIGAFAAKIAPKGHKIKSATFKLYNSFSHTYKGHGTDKALVAGLLGMKSDDIRIKNSLSIANDAGITLKFEPSGDDKELHPNTVDIILTFDDDSNFSMRGESLGGGKARIAAIGGIPINVSGDYPSIFIKHPDHSGMLAKITTALSAAKINIVTLSNFRDKPGGFAYTVCETDEKLNESLVSALKEAPEILDAFVLNVDGADLNFQNISVEINSGDDLADACYDTKLSIGELFKKREGELRGSSDIANSLMKEVLDTMRSETSSTIEKPERSLGGFLYRGAKSVMDANCTFVGNTLQRAISYAMATIELSATMGVIVAAPTAGSAGVIPGCLLATLEDEDVLIDALWCAAAIGAIITANGSVSGAEGGCQAEVGSASAMAAAAIVEANGGTPVQCLNAASIALVNILGLVCDPALGLVEYPCQMRNAIGVSNAFTAALLALSGIIPPASFDEAVLVALSVGHALPESLRETAIGGIASCFNCDKCK